MTAIQLKKLLVHRISEINDVSFLKALKTILDSKTDAEVLMLTEDQRQEIMQSKKEMQESLFMDQKTLDKKVAKWASAK
ncbi:hypothetical protein [Flavobacterium sp.]|uniref:hypothetical protein n=1 Tax=Flavobacterium sp. TaxID=239 RepID=UPI00262F7332|nr:hypothetical protein [Flavobacterium sp.]